MRGTISVVFTLHTLLCAGYVTYLAASLGRYMGQRLAEDPSPAGAAGLEAMLGSDERMTSAAAHGTLLLYLCYAEVYLYHSWRLFL